MAPLECCGLCLGDKIHDKTNCEDLNYCSNNGICTLGACECFEGYTGPDCSVHSGGGGGGDEPYGIPWWATLLVVAGSACVLSCSSIAVRYAFYTVRDARGGERGPGAWGEVMGVRRFGLVWLFARDPFRSCVLSSRQAGRPLALAPMPDRPPTIPAATAAVPLKTTQAHPSLT